MGRQTLTLLFTDVVASTELLGQLGERRADQVLREHVAAARHQIERHGGRPLKNLGDGVMSSFACSGDAIEAALAIQRGNAEGPQPRISIRVGLSSGDVQVEAADCYGTASVEASRLCALAAGGQVLIAESTRLLSPDREPLTLIGEKSLKGLARPTTVWDVPWTHTVRAPLRAVLADDAILLREGIARVLEGCGIDVLGQAGDAEELLRLIAEERPDVAIVDVRMPPTHTDEGMVAAERILREQPGTGVLMLSHDLEPHYATRLLAARQSGVGYLLKERVANVRAFADAARKVAGGGQAFEPAMLAADPAAEART